MSHVTQGNTKDNIVSRQYCLQTILSQDNTVSRNYATISKELLDELFNIYKFDFLLFNYTMDRYTSYVET